MSQTSAAPLRTTYCVFQIGSKLARSAWGTNRNVRAAARCEIAGRAIPPAAANAPAPLSVVRNPLRSISGSHSPLKGGNSFVWRDRGEVVKKLLQRMATLDVVDQRLNRNARANKHRGTAQDVRVGANDG